jgi:hypothetical protein
MWEEEVYLHMYESDPSIEKSAYWFQGVFGLQRCPVHILAPVSQPSTACEEKGYRQRFRLVQDFDSLEGGTL